MPKADAFDETFTTLRGILLPYAKEMMVQVDKPGNYQISSRTMKDRIGRPFFVAAVQIKKNYVSFHLMPVYAFPNLCESMSPELRRRMQGKSCFNFTKVDEPLFAELERVTTAGLEPYLALASEVADQKHPPRSR